MLALGESRLSAAYDALREKWERSVGSSTRKTLLGAMASSRLDDAIAFLVSLVESANIQTAGDAVEALTIYRHSERVTNKVREALAARGDKRLMDQLTQAFEGSG